MTDDTSDIRFYKMSHDAILISYINFKLKSTNRVDLENYYDTLKEKLEDGDKETWDDYRKYNKLSEYSLNYINVAGFTRDYKREEAYKTLLYGVKEKPPIINWNLFNYSRQSGKTNLSLDIYKELLNNKGIKIPKIQSMPRTRNKNTLKGNKASIVIYDELEKYKD